MSRLAQLGKNIAKYRNKKNLSQEKQTAENKAMIETYNKKVNFIDFSSLDKIIDVIKK